MRPISSLFSGWLREVTRDDQVALVFLIELWPQIVGDGLAQKATPVALDERVLTLSVPSEAWGNELSDLGRTIVKRVNTFWSHSLIRKVECKVRAG
jgi:hypothetical protein